MKKAIDGIPQKTGPTKGNSDVKEAGEHFFQLVFPYDWRIWARGQ